MCASIHVCAYVINMYYSIFNGGKYREYQMPVYAVCKPTTSCGVDSMQLWYCVIRESCMLWSIVVVVYYKVFIEHCSGSVLHNCSSMLEYAQND